MNGLSSIQGGDKFGAVCVTGMGFESHGAKVVELDDELSVYIDTKIDLTDHWREWIGSIKSDQIAVRGGGNGWFTAGNPLTDPTAPGTERVRTF